MSLVNFSGQNVAGVTSRGCASPTYHNLSAHCDPAGTRLPPPRSTTTNSASSPQTGVCTAHARFACPRVFIYHLETLTQCLALISDGD
ncbi:unnamed protein product [Arctogadus glacialis]